MLETVRGKKWLGLAIALVALVAFACGTKEVVKTVEIKVPGETVVVEKEVIKEVQVEVVVEKEVVKEVMVPGETIVVEKEVVKTVEVPGQTVVVEKEVVKEVEVEVVVEKEVVRTVEVPGQTVVVEKEVVKEVMVPGETVVVEKEVVKEVMVPGETVVVEKEVIKEVIKEVEVVREVEAMGPEKILRMRFKEAIAHINPFDSLSRPHGWAWNLMGSRLIFPDDLAMAWAPDLAERWEVSEDALSYTFYLRKGATFHDGEEVTADDVVFTFRTYLNSEASPRGPNALSTIKGAAAFTEAHGMGEVGIVKVDDYTVRFEQDFPNALFLDKCCNSTPIIMPEHILGDTPPAEIANYPWSTEFIGSGPFMLDVPFVADRGWTMKKNPNYFFGEPRLDKISFEFIETRDATFIAMQRGEIHGSSYPTLTAEMYQAFVTDPRFNVIGIKGSIMRSFMFNNNFEPTQDFRVRQAFLMAIDRKALIDAYWQGNGDIINTPFQNPLYHVPEYDSRYPYNPAKARELLAEAGWDSSIEIENKSYYVDREDFFSAIQAMLAEVGIQMKTTMQQGPAWVVDYYDKHDFELVFAGFGAPFDPDGWLISQMHTSAQNGGQYGNAELDTLIDKGRMATTPALRGDAYAMIAEDFIDRMPFLPILRQNEWWYKANAWHQPVLSQARQATSFSTIEILPVFLNSGSWSKYHAERWDLDVQ